MLQGGQDLDLHSHLKLDTFKQKLINLTVSTSKTFLI